MVRRGGIPGRGKPPRTGEESVMRIRNLYPGSWGSNCYLLLSGTHAAVVDPSAPVGSILDALREEGAQVDCILLTHGHFDHIVSLDALREKTGAPALIHADDMELPGDARKNAFFTVFGMDRHYRTPNRALTDGARLELGDESIRVIHTPGHTAGSVCYLCGEGAGAVLLTGDTLFAQGVGRTDLYGGDSRQLAASLARLRSLPPELPIHPGHGPSGILGEALDFVNN